MELDYAAEWFKYADTDFATAEFLLSMHPCPMEIICYHCQQSAEKFLKGYLIYRGVMEPPKTHNLIFLHTMCQDMDNHFDEISRACEALNRYGVQPRYPNEMEVQEQDMQKAVEYARQIRDSKPLIGARERISQSSSQIYSC